MSVSLKIKDQNGAYAYTYAADAPATATQKTLTDTPWMTVKFVGDPGKYTFTKNNETITPIGSEAMFTLAGPPLLAVVCEVTSNSTDLVHLDINSTSIFISDLDKSFKVTFNGKELDKGYTVIPTKIVTGGDVLLIQAL